MNKTNERIRNKIRSTKGETISETLVALLIAALALVMLAGVVSSASRIVTQSRESLDAYYDECDEMVLSYGSGGSTGSVTITGDGISAVAGITEDVSYIENDEFNVISYRLKTQ